MTTITNDIIIKAAKAAGLDVSEAANGIKGTLLLGSKYPRRIFYPLHNDTDNAMIMDGAEISITYFLESVSASFYIDEHGMHSEPQPANNGKSQARRDAVILCAAAKWDAMNKEKVKS